MITLQKKLTLATKLANKYGINNCSYNLLGLLGRILLKNNTRDKDGNLYCGANRVEMSTIIDTSKNKFTSTSDFSRLQREPPHTLKDFLIFIKNWQ